MRKALAFDIGGTKIYSTIIDERGKLLKDPVKFFTPKDIDGIKDVLRGQIKKYEDEVDVIKVFNKSLSDNFYFPLTKGEAMTFHKVESLDDLETGNFNVREPKEYCSEIFFKKDKEYLVIVPGAAFDKNGYRIGYGKGFYDKFFAKNKDVKFTKIGVCFKECFVDEIDYDEYDYPVDEVYFA